MIDRFKPSASWSSASTKQHQVSCFPFWLFNLFHTIVPNMREMADTLVILLFILVLSSTVHSSCVFDVWYPDSQLGSHSLYMRGNGAPLSWKSGVALSRIGPDHWTLSLSSCTRTNMQVKVLIDDETWQLGANIECPCFPCTVSPFFFNSHGGEYVYIRNVSSPQLGNARDLVVYLPPSFYENPYASYSLLVMHDGQNVFNASTAFMGNSWHAAETLDSLILGEETLREVMVLAIDNTPDRIDELTYSVDPTVGQGGKADLYLDFIWQTAIPRLMDEFPNRVSLDWDMTILGSSLGGLVSCYAAMTRPDTFRRAGCMSSSFWWNNQDFLGTVLPAHAKDALAHNVVVYLDSGDAGPDDDDVVQTGAVTNAMIQDGWVANRTIQHYVAHGAQHSEIYWSQRFWIPLMFFFGVPPA